MISRAGFIDLESGFAPLESRVRTYSNAPAVDVREREVAICADCGRETHPDYAAAHDGRCSLCATSGWRDSDDYND